MSEFSAVRKITAWLSNDPQFTSAAPWEQNASQFLTDFEIASNETRNDSLLDLEIGLAAAGGGGNMTTMHPPPNLGEKVAQLFFLTIVIFASIFLNGIVLYILMKCAKLRTPGNLFVLNLCLVNFVNGVLLVPLTIGSAAAETWPFGNGVCQATAFLQLLFLAVVNLTLPMIAIDRYYAIVKPMVYTTFLTKRRVGYSLAMCWLGSLIISVPPFWGWSHFAYHAQFYVCSVRWHAHPVFTVSVLVVIYLMPLFVMLTSYAYIFAAAKFQHRAIAQKGRKALDDEFTPMYSSKAHAKLANKLPWVVQTYSSPYKAARTIALLIVSFQLSWTVFMLWVFWEIAGHFSPALAFCAFFTTCITTAMHPLLYGFLNKTIRKRIRRRFLTKQKDARLPPDAQRAPNTGSSGNSTASFASLMDFLPKTRYVDGVNPSELMSLSKKADESSYSLTAAIATPAGPLGRSGSRRKYGRASIPSRRRQLSGKMRRATTAPGEIYYPNKNIKRYHSNDLSVRRPEIIRKVSALEAYADAVEAGNDAGETSADEMLPLHMEVEFGEIKKSGGLYELETL